MACASNQAGFDFSDDDAQPIAAEDPPGTWLITQLTTAQYRQHAAVATRAATRLDPLLQRLFLYVIEQIEPRLEKMAETIDDDGSAYTLSGIGLEVPPEVWEAFAKGCDSQQWAGCETRVRHGPWCSIYAVYVPQVGSLVGHRWDQGSYHLHYDVGRDAELRPSYDDGAPRFDVPARLWPSLYCSKTLAEARDKPASVRTYAIQGRRYIITCIGSRGGHYSQACAWSVVAASDWRGPTYTYREQCRAWDEGRKERGDQSGLVVMIGGQRCVLNSYALFIDQTGDPWSCAVAQTDDATAESDERDDDLDLEEGCDADA